MHARVHTHTQNLCATMMVIPATQRFTRDNKYVLPAVVHINVQLLTAACLCGGPHAQQKKHPTM